MANGKTWHEKHTESRTFGSRLADYVANGMGSWSFIIIQTVLVILWMSLNLVGWIYHWDVYCNYNRFVATVEKAIAKK